MSERAITREEAETAIDTVERLIYLARVALHASGEGFPDDDVAASIGICDDTATLSWLESDGDYEHPLIRAYSADLPVSVLLLSEDPILVWGKNVKDERNARAIADAAEYRREAAEQTAMRERAEYDRLKAKFGDAA
jgi:hypothetical protein